MRYPRNIAEKLGFDQILEMLAGQCATERARALIPHIQFMVDPELIATRLDQAAEMVQVLEQDGFNTHLPIDIHIDRKKAGGAGFFYSEEAFVELIDALHAVHALLGYFKGKGQRFTLLAELFADLDMDPDVAVEIASKFDRDGKLKNNASKELAELHQRIKRAERSILKQSNVLFQTNKEAGLLADTELSIRQGRVVLPVLSEHKRKVEGLLIDQSSSGKISYIEPLNLVHLNNELAELQIALRNEVVQVLRSLTQQLLPELPALQKGLQAAGAFDLIRAKARLCIANNWTRPILDNEMEWVRARHPLLEVKLSTEGRTLIPLNLALNQDQRMLVISGPNAGGKSVALKTVGLLQYMLQSGLPVPVDAQSRFRIFQHIFVDIGDDQSIESDLSTYSSHLSSAKQMVNHADSDSLVLMDEIGTGTDPMFGGPMAQAILESIHNKGAYGVVTTHFSNIKTTARELKHAVNGAMLFDTEHLKPLYRLEVGQAGSSFAYEVARNIGLNRSLIKKARSYTDTRQYDLDRMLAEVQQEREELNRERAELEELRATAARLEASYRDLNSRLEKERKGILDAARKEALGIILDSNKAVEQTIREIKEGKAQKDKTRLARKRLDTQKEGLRKDEQPVQTPEFKLGDQVQMKEGGMAGEVLEVGKKKVTVAFGSLRTKVSPDQLQKLGAGQQKKVQRYLGSSGFSERQEQFKPELDVRGKRTEEALRLVEQWIDSAIILGVSQLRLIHGKGHGILRGQIRSQLKRMPQIRSVEHETEQHGGDGVSIIELH